MIIKTPLLGAAFLFSAVPCRSDRLGQDDDLVFQVLDDTALHIEGFFTLTVRDPYRSVKERGDNGSVIVQQLEAAVCSGNGDRAYFSGVNLLIGGDDFEQHLNCSMFNVQCPKSGCKILNFEP